MGYIGFSMSERAASAYRHGLLPASKLAKVLGVSAAAVRECCRSAEWHHTSKNFNRTDFYRWEDDPDEETSQDQAERLARMKEFDRQKKAAVVETFAAQVEWIEWTGTRNHPKAIEHSETAQVSLKGKCYTITLASGQTFRKFEGTNGFNVRRNEK